MNTLIFVSTRSNTKLAVTFGSLIAGQTQSSVTLLTVIGESQIMDMARQLLDKAKLWIPGLDVQTSVRIDVEVKGILEEISCGSYDLIIITARKSIQLKEILRAKLARQVARYSPISFLVVKKTQSKLNRVLICTSGQEIAGQVIEIGARLTQAAQAQATLLYVTDPVPSMYTGLAKIEETLPDILQSATPIANTLRQGVKILTRYRIEAELELRNGSVPDEILREAHLVDYDLIVIGSSKAPVELTGRVLGNVTQEIVDKIQCPVLVVWKAQELS